jgi:hypothetical protein
VSQLGTRPYTLILNIGCAEGYYAVGFARLLPEARILAFDTDPDQQAHCRANAKLNGVSGRISVAGLFKGEAFDSFAGERTLVICDIEGGEIELLQPEKWPPLCKMDLLIELHEDRVKDMVEVFRERFSDSHQIIHVPRQLVTDIRPIEALFANEMDQLAAIFENRFGPTSWIVATQRTDPLSV